MMPILSGAPEACASTLGESSSATVASVTLAATASYGEVAAAIGAPTSHRAVARACAANALAVAIPCHRVIRSDGALAGYRWGIERKRALLAAEQRAASAEGSAHKT